MNLKSLFCLAVALAWAPGIAVAGALDDAPFRVVIPDGEWKIDDAAAKPMAQGVALMATVSNSRLRLKSIVIRETLAATNDNALNELTGGIHDSFAKRKITEIAQSDTPFLGFKARNFAYEMVHGTQTNYNATTVFVAGDNGWTITCIGRPEQSNEVQRIFNFFRLRSNK